MGTNYYVRPKSAPCPTCGHDDEVEEIHIGKSSIGWVFSLHVTDDLPDIGSWLEFLTQHPNNIFDEYDENISLARMISNIVNRYCPRREVTDRMLAENQAVLGPNGLLRSKESDHVTHGKGTWDYHKGDFS